VIPIIEFVLGIAVLVYSAEKLIGHLVGSASRWAISLFLVAVVFTGIEFDDLAFGIVLNLEDLSEVALGTVVGTTTAMTGIVLALAAIIAPTPVDVPKDYLALFGPEARLHGFPAGIEDVDGLVRFHAATADTFPDAEVTLDDAVAEGDRVATRFTWRASQGPGLNLVAQGGAMMQFADGQIVECWNLPTELRAVAAQ